MFNDSANLTKFHRRKRDKSCSKDPYFLCRKTLRNGIALCQDLYLSMIKLSNLSPFGNLSHGVFFSVDFEFFFRRRRSMNIRSAVAGNPRFHDIKTLKCSTVLDTPFQIAIVRLYLAAMIVLHLDTYKARAMFSHRYIAVKKSYGASFNWEASWKIIKYLAALVTSEIRKDQLFAADIFRFPDEKARMFSKWRNRNYTLFSSHHISCFQFFDPHFEHWKTEKAERNWILCFKIVFTTHFSW